MENFWKRHRESMIISGIGLLLFACLNVLMLQTNFDLWTSTKVGYWSAFHKGFQFSGFDGHTYIVISQWRPLFTLFRHPLLAAMMWPLAELNDVMRDATGMNCSIIIVAAVWTLLATTSWWLLYKLMRTVVKVGIGTALLLCMLYFGFAYVMLATFIPDHMVISQTLFLLMLWMANRPSRKGKAVPAWQSLLMAFVAMGVATTNIAKIWIIDMMNRAGRTSWGAAVKHSMLYLIPALIMAGAYVYQENTTQAEDTERAKKTEEKRLATDKRFADKAKKMSEAEKSRQTNQVVETKLFEWTDTSVDRWKTLTDNVFGEGLILHEDHLMEDANKDRPTFVAYHHWWTYAVEAMTGLLFVAGIWCGRRQRLLLTLLALMAFDMLLHLGFCFAIKDVYIMTAHWAFIIPIAMAYLSKGICRNRFFHIPLLSAIALITAYLWWHNASLMVKYILG